MNKNSDCNYNKNLHDNITFFFEEKDNPDTDENLLHKIIEEINQDEEEEYEEEEYEEEEEEDELNINNNNYNKLMFFLDKEFYGNDELFYNQEYTIKDLLKICQYYDIEKNIKSSKCKKQDIVSTIVYFESLPENYEKVKKRNLMWAYMTELMNDTKMKKYVFWK
jgi:hypothetical protein